MNTRWVERRRLALALSTLQRLEVGDLTASMAKAFFSALAKGWLAIAKLKPLSLFIPLF